MNYTFKMVESVLLRHGLRTVHVRNRRGQTAANDTYASIQPLMLTLLYRPYVFFSKTGWSLRPYLWFKVTFCRRYGEECSRYSASLRAGRSGDRIPVRGQLFRTRPERPWGPPSLLYNGHRVSFPGVKRPGRGLNHSPPSSAEVKERIDYTSTPPLRFHGLF